MALHKFTLDFDAKRLRNEERRRIDEWLKSNAPRFEAVAGADGTAELYLDGVIGDDFGGVSAPRFQQQLDSLKDAKEITVHVNSPGGFIDDGMAMYNALARHSAKIITNVVGQAASSASFIVQAGDERRMGESTAMFLHRALGLTYGNDEDHEKMAAYLKQNTEAIANVYAKRSGRRADSFLKMMSEDTQLTAQQALDAKLIDSIVPLKKQNAVQNSAEQIVVQQGNVMTVAGAAPGATVTVVELQATNAKAIIDRKLRMMAMEEA